MPLLSTAMRRFVVIAASAAMLASAAACGGSSSPSAPPNLRTATPTTQSTTAASTTLKVMSTIDGKTVLPPRIHWSATTTLPNQAIKTVQFLVDGRTAWVEHNAPYIYADPGGYLVTSWLKPGTHRFTARAVATNGRTATDTVIARVRAAPQVPAQLAGSWQRKISNTSGAPADGTPGNPTGTLTPPGTYTLSFDRPWIHDTFPCSTSPCRFVASTGAGTVFDSDWTPGLRTFRVRGEVTFRDAPNTARLAGWWCETSGPAATYSWSVSGRTLTLKPVGGNDACGIRGFVWAGTWTRAE